MANRQNLIHYDKTGNIFKLNPLSACVRAVIAGGVIMGSVAPVLAELPIAGVGAMASPTGVAIPWVGSGSATHQIIGNTLRVDQQSDKAILNWQKFNVGKENTVQFNQPGASSIALNRIYQQDASQILGTVKANGQIYLVNQNGFVFGKDSVVNTRGLVASTLDVTQQAIDKGISKVTDLYQSPSFQGSGDFYQKNPDGTFKLDANGKKIKIAIDIQNGAQIKSAENGRILVLAPTILNSGNVESPGGQVIMAAATDKVYLQEAPTSGTHSDVRGLLVEVETGGKVENLGNISAKHGNVTLMGFAVNQKGKVSATTTTNLNGTIRLLAREGGKVEVVNSLARLQATNTTRTVDNGDDLGLSAKVTLDTGSSTEISPEIEYIEEEQTLASGEIIKRNVEKTTIDKQAQPQSRVEIMGHKVHLRSDSKITLPGGKVEVTATKAPDNPFANIIDKNDSRVLMEAGAKIDVSGTDTAVKTMESNVVEVELRNFELKDAPLQKNGILKGKTVLVDIREGTPLTDIQPFVDAIKRNIDERLVKGGQISLQSEGDVILEKDAVLDFSGGAVTYLDGNITTTKLVSDRQLVDISKADPLFTYTGIFGEVIKKYEKWGVTTTWKLDGPFALGRFEKGYVEGRDAGSLLVKGNHVILDGDLVGHAQIGRRQRNLADQARGGQLDVDTAFLFNNVQSIMFSGQAQNTVDLDKVVADALEKGEITTRIDAQLPTAADGLIDALALQPGKLFEGGIRDATFKSNGTVTVSEDANLKLADGGILTLKGGAIDVLGDIEGTGATVNLETALSKVSEIDGDITIASGAYIGLQGAWVNDFKQPDNLEGKPVAINGGAFSAKAAGSAGGNVNLQAGSQIDVSGGAWLKADRNLVAGDAGSISLTAQPEEKNVGANVMLDGILNAFGLERGGRFKVTANAVAIRREETEVGGEDVKPLQIGPSFFGKGGFAEFDIGSNLNGLTVEEDAVINLSQTNRVLNATYLNQSNAKGIEAFSQVATLLPSQRVASKLTLRTDHLAGNSPDINNISKLSFEKNAKIIADDLSDVTLTSDSSLVFDGEINAHGGTVALVVTPIDSKESTDFGYQETQSIWLGNTAKIDVSGSSQIITNNLGHRSGNVFDGGKVVIDAKRGFFASQADSRIDVSGTQAVLDLPANSPNAFGTDYQPTLLGSHAGKVDITAAEGLFIDGKMFGNSGGTEGSAGGTLSVILNINNRGDTDPENSFYPRGPRTLLLSQEKNLPFSETFNKFGDALPDNLAGNGYLAATQITEGGFSSLDLAVSGENGEIRFQGDIDLELKNAMALEAVKFGWESKSATDTGNVRLKATTATLGSDIFRATPITPVDGMGHFLVTSDLIDLVGGSVTSGFNTVELSSNGDIRLKGVSKTGNDDVLGFFGEFKTFSGLTLTADQVYPTSLTRFNLAVSGNPDGTVTFNQGGGATPVLSAAGQLTVQAPNIEQNGSIKAPLGEIILEASNSIRFGGSSLTSVAADNQLIPLGVTQGGLDWLLPLSGTSNSLVVDDPTQGNGETDKNLIFEAPQKKITVKADKILKEDGALVELSGGGDLLAYEFIPGSGGSKDVLDSDQIFAVVPGLSDYSPFDPKEFANSGLKTGNSIFISGGSGLAEGNYALLPARYALLPGAFLVTPQSPHGDVIPGSSRTRIDGASIVSGYHTVAGTDIRDQRWSEFVIEPGSIAKTRSEYHINLASSFFAERAINKELTVPRSTQDAGQVVFNAISQLDLPTVRADAENNGRGGLVDIVSENLAVVTAKTGATGIVELLAGDIDKFKVESLLLGAIRSFDATTGNIKLDVKAKSVTVAENTTLNAPETLLAATDKVELKTGAQVKTEGTVADTAANNVLEVNGDGALLRVSAGNQAAIKRTGVSGSTGDLLVNKGAVMSAGTGSVLLDSTLNSTMDGELELAGGSLSLAAQAINLGEVSSVNTGLSLDSNQLNKLTLKELFLTSRSSVNLYGQLAKTDSNGNSAPVEFGNLVIDAAGLSGWQNDGKSSFLNANKLTLTNSTGVTGTAGSGTGILNINAEELVLDKGSYQLSGFDQVNLSLADSLSGQDTGQLTALSNIDISTPYVSAQNGANSTIDATGHHLALHQANQNLAATTQGIGAQLKLIADSIDVNTTFLYKTGNVSANALQGDVKLGSKALVDVSGAVANAGLSKPVNLSAGKIFLSSQNQNVTADTGSQMLLGGINDAMQAGSLNVQAAKGQVRLNGLIDAHGIGKANGGSIAIDTGTLTANGFNSLNNLFSTAGFTNGVDVKLHTGDIIVDAGQTITANTINLTADSGKILVGGLLDATGVNGGMVKLAAEDTLTLDSGARIFAGAHDIDGKGGKVYLSSIDQHNDGAGIEIKNGARIDVSATGSGEEGQVKLRADRLDADNNGADDEVNINTIAQGAITGDSDVTVEAVKIYTDTSITLADQNTYHADNQSYLDSLTANHVQKTRFDNGFTIIPGLEVRSSDDLTIADAWDLATWRYGASGLPGELTLRAARDILVEQNLSDAFAVGQIDLGVFGVVDISDFLQAGQSWSYNLVAGADLTSADSSAVVADTGDIKLSGDVKVRTGTGDISIQAGRDIVYDNNNSVIYTAGRPDEANRWGFSPLISGGVFYAEYPLDGGDISLNAGRDILAKPTTQLMSDWLVRTGNWTNNDDHSNERPTAWGIAFSGYSTAAGDGVFQHQHSLAALGGGSVNVSAGRNINDLSVTIPTTGKQTGIKAPSELPDNFDYLSNSVEINGGGNLDLFAGGDIAGGVFYVDGGAADLRTAGSLIAGSNQDAENRGLSPILALGDSGFSVTAAKNIALEAIIDPMIVPQSQSADLFGIQSNFFRYSADSRVELTSLSGNITLENDATALDEATNAGITDSNPTTMNSVRVYPASLKVNALHGDINIDGNLNMYPSSQGTLELFAANAITGNAVVHLADADPFLLPSELHPVDSLFDAMNRLEPAQNANLIHAAEPLHVDDKKPALISTGNGNIGEKDLNLEFVLAKPAEIKAGKDIVNTSFQIQHNSADANSMISAGRDAHFLIKINPKTGIIEPTQEQRIIVAGPGQLTILAGRDIDLGGSHGITSIGNTKNTALADDGADISVVAGLADGQLNVNGFAEKFLANDKYALENQLYLDRFVAEMRLVTGDESLTEETAKAAFNNLPVSERSWVEGKLLSSVQQVFFKELKLAGSKGAKATTKQDQDQAELELLAAVETLFPGTTLLSGNNDYSVDPFKGVAANSTTSAGAILDKINADAPERPKLGDISLPFSTIQTVDGGDVNLMTPNGGVTAGLPASIDLAGKGAGDLGIIDKKKGDINGIVRNNFDVNTGRVTTLGGGDVLIVSTEEDIAAGRSPKSQVSASETKVSPDNNGFPIIEVSPPQQGGGISANSPPGVPDGNVDLFAFRGIIDAGEAGIAGNNVTLGATAIVGADNIDIGGVGVGVPVAPTGSIAAGLTGVSNLTASVTNAIESSTNIGEETNKTVASTAALGILSVDFLGFGDSPDEDEKKRKK